MAEFDRRAAAQALLDDVLEAMAVVAPRHPGVDPQDLPAEDVVELVIKVHDFLRSVLAEEPIMADHLLAIPLSKVPFLAGWPIQAYGLPSDQEREMIEAAFAELAMSEPDLGDPRCWVIAGNIVARFRRDLDG